MPTNTADKIENITPFLKSLPMLEHVNPETLRYIAQNSKFVSLDKGQELFQEGSPAAGGYFVSSGRVALRKSTFRNNKLTLELLGPLDAFGVVSAAKGIPYPLTAEVLTESVCLHIEQDFLMKLAASEPTIMVHLLDICTKRIQHQHRLMAALADAESDNRIAGALLVFAEKFGTELENGVEVNVTRQELASLAVTSVETCIRITRAFEDKGWVTFPRAKHILVANRIALEKLCLHPRHSECE
jgi:CRP-like cAMP-binding protein